MSDYSGGARKPSEVRHNIRGVSDQMVKGVWEIDPPPLSSNFNRYANGAANLHVHFRIRGNGISLDADEFCAIFVESHQPMNVLGTWCITSGADRHGGVLYTVAYLDELPMFVGVIEATGASQGVNVAGCDPISSAELADLLIGRLVGLDGLDLCQKGLRKSTYCLRPTFPEFVVERDPVGPVGALAENGETGAPSVPSRHVSDDKVVQRGAHIMDYVSDDKRDHHIRSFREAELVNERPLLSIGTTYRDGLVTVLAGEPLNLAVEFLEVMVCPIELEVERFLHRSPR